MKLANVSLAFDITQQPAGDKQNAKQDAAKAKPANAAPGQAAEKSKEENAEATMEKDVDELRKAIDGELPNNCHCFL